MLPYLPVPRHRRPTDAERADESPLVNATFVRITIVFTILFVMAMTALIWYRWYPVHLPTSSLMFIGNESLDGAVAVISMNGHDAYTVTIDKQDSYIATVWLSPGHYGLVVSRDNRVIQRASVVVGQMQKLVDTLPGRAESTTAPSTRPAEPSGGPSGKHVLS